MACKCNIGITGRIAVKEVKTCICFNKSHKIADRREHYEKFEKGGSSSSGSSIVRKHECRCIRFQSDRPGNSIRMGWKRTDKDGNKVTAMQTEELSKEVEEILKDEEQVKEILKEAGYEVTEDQNAVVLGAGNIELVDGQWDGMEMPEGGVDLELRLETGSWDWDTNTYVENETLKDLKDGDTVYVLHQKADGTWEVLEGTAVVEDL